MADQTRCDRAVEVEYRYARATRKWVRLYLLMPLVLLPFFPILAADYILALPMCMLYMLGIGPVLVIARDPALCCECGALVGKDQPVPLPVPTPSSR
jgi:hypothetical protein